MEGDSRSFSLDISEHLFRLTTESLRLHSNATMRHETLADLVSDRIDAPCQLDDYAPETIRDHLSTVPTTGEIRITLEIAKSSADNLEEVKERFAQSLGSNLTIADTLSILLFHYVAGQKAAAVLQRIGFETAPLTNNPTDDREPPSDNVVPIR